MFSFNNPYGACPVCTGLGIQKRVDPDRVIPNRHLSIKQGAIRAPGWGSADTGSIAAMYYNALGKKHGFTLETPIEEFSEQALDELLYGTGDEPLELSVSRISGGVMRQPFEGIIPNLERRYRETNSEWSRGEIEEVMSESPCPACHGQPSAPGGAGGHARRTEYRGVCGKVGRQGDGVPPHAQADRNAAQNRVTE